MNRMQYNSEEQEYYNKKEKLRQEAISKEMVRLNKKNAQFSREIRLYRLGTIGLIIVLLIALFLIIKKESDFNGILANEIVTDTVWLKSDTVFLEVQQEKAMPQQFYSIQIIAYAPGKVPLLDSTACLNLNKYSINNLYGLSLGAFTDSMECKKFLDLLRKAGNREAMMVEVKNKKRLRIISLP